VLAGTTLHFNIRHLLFPLLYDESSEHQFGYERSFQTVNWIWELPLTKQQYNAFIG